MIKVKASLIGELPTDVVIDIPKSCCNRSLNKYIKGYLSYLFSGKSKIYYEVLDDDINRENPSDDECLSDSFCTAERTKVG